VRLQVRWNRWRSSTARTSSARRRGRPPRAPRRTGGGDDQERGVRRAEQIDRGGSDDQAEQRAAARSAEDEQLGAGAEVEEQSGGLLLLDHPLDLDLRVDDGPRREGVVELLPRPVRRPVAGLRTAVRRASAVAQCSARRPAVLRSTTTRPRRPVRDQRSRCAVPHAQAHRSRRHATGSSRWSSGKLRTSAPSCSSRAPVEVADHRAGLEEPQRSMSGTTVRRTPLW